MESAAVFQFRSWFVPLFRAAAAAAEIEQSAMLLQLRWPCPWPPNSAPFFAVITTSTAISKQSVLVHVDDDDQVDEVIWHSISSTSAHGLADQCWQQHFFEHANQAYWSAASEYIKEECKLQMGAVYF